MPVADLSYARLRRLVGGGATKRQISGALPFLGLDIESEDGDLVRVEYSPNRPDYSTDLGIALGLQGLLGTKTGAVRLAVRASGRHAISVKPAVSGIRPFVTGIVARNGRVDDHTIRQLVAMQEDLHAGVGRRRAKSSVGVHDMGGISFPLAYTVAGRDHRFVPLHHDDHDGGGGTRRGDGGQMSISEILRDTDVGRTYGHILGDAPEVPVILDAAGRTVSFPPIINSAMTTVTTRTRNVFVEVTGIGKKDCEDVLAVIATFLQSAGFALESVRISGAGNSAPALAPRTMTVRPSLVNETLGTSLSTASIVSSLRRSRLGAVARTGGGAGRGGRGKGATATTTVIACTVPPHRFDIFGPMDLVEEVALGYGIQNLEPVLSPPGTLGQASPESVGLRSLARTMVGLGYMEAMNTNLTSMRILDPLQSRDPGVAPVSVLDSKSLGHTVLRDSVLAGLLENISRNIHEPYPQRLFEIGTVFAGAASAVSERTCLSGISAHAGASFTEAKAVLLSMLQAGPGLQALTRTMTQDHPLLDRGRSAVIVTPRTGTQIGTVGEIDPAVREAYRIRVPVAGFEIHSVSELVSGSLV